MDLAAAAAPHYSFEPESAPTRRYRVLLVEDNSAEAELVVESLSGSTLGGFDITLASTLHQARAICGGAKFDCLVLDLHLPDSTGVDTISTMRAHCPDAAIVAYSGLEDECARAAALREGAQDFVSKNGPECEALNRGILFAVERWRAIKLHRQFQGLFAANPDAMVIIDAKGVIQFANSAAFYLFEGHESGLIGARLGLDVQQGGTTQAAFFRDGKRREGEVRAFDCIWDGEPAILAAIHDVTEQNQLTERLRKAQKLEAIGQFAGGLAHDFGNVLSCIDVFVDLARTSDPTTSQPTCLAGVSRAVQSGKSIVRQLLSLEQGGNGEPELVDLGAMLSDLSGLFRRAIPNNIDLKIDIGAGLWPVMIDRGQLEQVILNLTINARDAMPDGGELKIECANAPARGDAADGVTLRVTDTGTGVAAEHRERVFDLFFTTKPTGRGTGLGLAMCQTIVEKAGGAISLTSSPGEGASFLVTLPRAHASAPAWRNAQRH
jgi:two-component system cell cycle sensor histidine kinase/response regulator CckA